MSRNRKGIEKKQERITADPQNLQHEIRKLSKEFTNIGREILEATNFLKGLYTGLFLGVIGNLLVSHWIIVLNTLLPEGSSDSLYFSIFMLFITSIAVLMAVSIYRSRYKQFLERRKETLEYIQKLERAKSVMQEISIRKGE